MTIGNKIKALRKESLLTLSELAKKVGCSQPHLSMVETGARNPSLELLEKLDTAFQVPRDTLRLTPYGNVETIDQKSFQASIKSLRFQAFDLYSTLDLFGQGVLNDDRADKATKTGIRAGIAGARMAAIAADMMNTFFEANVMDVNKPSAARLDLPQLAGTILPFQK